MATDIGAKIGIDGESAFKASLSAINSQLKNLGSEMKSVVSTFSGMENSEEAVAAKSSVLQRSISASAEKMKTLQNQSERAKEKLASLAEGLEKAKQKFGENSRQVLEAQNDYNRQVTVVNKLETQINQTTTEMNRMEREMRNLRDSTDDLSNGFEKTEKSALNMKTMLKVAFSAVAAVASTLTGLGVAAVKVGGDFEESMSQVAATMGMTVEEIHNGSEAYDTLAAAAKDAGSTTKFTATQAAEALNYLALAGYDAATSAEVLPSVLNLAAAGGLDLAYASDLATDAMAALGIEANADNLTQFGDQMAKASSKANYSVAQLGEAILTVGGTAKNLAGGTVELNTALGVLANRGIKGAEGGTALRNMILSLSAPTDKAAATMKSLGLSAFDAEGNLRPLNEVFKDLDTSMQNLSGEEKTNALNDIFNKVDLKSAEAMLAGCGTEFDNLANAIANSNGAMQDMADVQIDNLKGSMTILGSGLEGVGIQVYEKFETPLKEAAQTAIDAVGDVSRSLKSGKLSTSVDNLAKSTGTLMEELTALAVKALPKAIDGMATVLDHTKEIKSALLAAATAVGTFKAVNTLAPIIKSWQAAAKVMSTYAATAKASQNAELLLISTLKAKEIIVGVVTGKIALMTAAQTAFNAVTAACPIGLLIAGAAALTIGLVSLLTSTKEESEALQEFRKRLEETTSSIEEQAEARKTMKEAAQESINQSLSEMDYTESLIGQLKELCDANGQVKAGYENRARALAEQINSVIPDAIQLTEKEGQAYVQTADNLELLMEKKRVNALLNAKEEAYTAAIQNQAEAMQNMLTLEDDIAAKKEELTGLQEAYNAALQGGTTGEYTAAAMALQQAQDDLATMEGLYQQQAEIRRNNYETIDEYNSLLVLSQSNSVEELKAGLNDYIYQQVKVTDETKDQLDQQLENSSRFFATALEQARSAGYDIGEAELNGLLETKNQFLQAVQAYAEEGREIPKELQAGVEENAALFADALVAMKDNGLLKLEKAEAEMTDLAKNCTEGFAKGLLSESAVNKVVSAAEKLSSKALSIVKGFFNINSPSRVMRDEVGKQIAAGVAVGIEEGTGEAVEAAETMAAEVVAAAEDMDSMIPFARKTAKKVGDVLKNELEKTNSQLEAMQKKANEEKAAQELKQYQDNLAKKHEELNKAEKKNKQKIQDEITKLESDWNKKQADAARTAEQKKLQEKISALQEFQKEYESALSSIESKQSSLSDKLGDYGSLFKRVETEEGKELFQLGDLNAEIKKIEKYGEAIDKLRVKGISDGLMGEISGMGVDDALDYMNKLISMSDTKFDQYVELFAKKQQAAQGVAEKFYKEEFHALEQSYTEKLPETLEGVKAGMYQAGAEAAQSLKDGLQSDGTALGDAVATAVSDAVVGASEATQEENFQQITEGMAEQEPILTEYVEGLKETLISLIESYYGDFRDVGKQMMDGVAQGIEDGRSGVVNAVASVIAAAVRRARSDLDINSPSKVFAEIGGYMAAGLDEGWQEKMKIASNNISRSLAAVSAPPMTLQRGGIDGNGSHTYTYGDINVYVDTVNNGNDRDVQRLATELEFYRRQQETGRGGSK